MWLTTPRPLGSLATLHKRGCRVVVGVDLYVRQTALALATWTGTPTDLAGMHDAAEEFLGL